MGSAQPTEVEDVISGPDSYKFRVLQKEAPWLWLKFRCWLGTSRNYNDWMIQFEKQPEWTHADLGQTKLLSEGWSFSMAVVFPGFGR